MPWVRLDDGFAEHPKVATAGPLAIALHVSALCYCSRQLTDGFVPAPMLARLIDLSGIVVGIFDEQMVTTDSQVYPYELANALVEAGLWKKVPGGYLIHDYLEYNPSREEVREKRRVKEAQAVAGGKARAAAGERDEHGRFVSAGQSSYPPADHQPQHQRYGPAQTQPKPAPGPEPVPEPVPPESQIPAPAGAKLNGNPKSPNDIQNYLVGWLRDFDPEHFGEKAFPWSVVVSLNGKHGRPTVTSALQRLREAPPKEMVTNAVGLLCNTIEDVKRDASAWEQAQEGVR